MLTVVAGLSHPFHRITTVNDTEVFSLPEETGSGRRSGGPSFGRLLDVLRVLRRRPATVGGSEELGDCLRAVRALRAWADAYEAEVLTEASRRDAAREAGAVDTAGWLRTHTGVTRREALSRSRTAEGLEGLPGVRTALAQGRITHGHAQALTQIAAPAGVDLDIDPSVDFPSSERTVALAARDQQDDLIRTAEAMSVDEYRRFLRRWADRIGGDDGAQRALRHRRERRATTFDTDDGMRGLRAVLPPEQFALFENELRRLAEARWRAEHPDADGVPATQLSCPQRNADALVDMARRSRQLGDNNGEPLGSHIDVMVLIDAETLEYGLHDGSRCELDDTTPIPPVAARRMLCDANILTAVRDRTGFRLDLGYSQRCATRKIRKALIARDRTCTAAGCDRPHWMCEIHHIVPWAEGGRTDLDNLTLLCSKHHHLHHANERRRPSPEPAPDLQPDSPPMERAAPHRVTPTTRRAPTNGQAPGVSCDSPNGRINSGPPQRAPASPDGSPAADVPPRRPSP